MANPVGATDFPRNLATNLLLRTKLFIPQARHLPDLLPRSRLVEQLQRGLTNKLTLVSAPAGYGKTVLLTEWIPQSPRCVCWVSLDETDNDIARFLTYCIAALQMLKHDFGQTLLAVLQAPQPPAVESLITALVNEIVQTLDDFALVLDDYHLIQQPAIHAAVAFLLQHLPPNMHLILTSRADPPLPLARLRVRGQMTELRAADLRFTLDETAAFFQHIQGVSLPVAQVRELETRTEGWGAGLRLAALSLQRLGTAEAARFISDFTGSHRSVFDYLAEEVLQQQPAEILRFLLRTSILDRLCSPLCEAILNGKATSQTSDEGNAHAAAALLSVQPNQDSSRAPASGQEILEYLERANLFLIPLDNERHWYRYHHLFAEVLRLNLHSSTPTEIVADLHRRASVWHAQEQLMDEAVNHALAGRDFEEAARLIDYIQATKWQTGEIKTLQSWLAALPMAAWRTYPRLWLVQAWAAITVGELSLADEKLRMAEESLTLLDAEIAQSLQPEILAFRASYASLVQDPHAIDLAQQALRELPKDYWLRGMLVVFLGAAYYAMGNLNAAADVLAQRSGSILSTPDTQSHQIHRLALGGIVHHAKGCLRDAWSLIQQALELAEPGGKPILFVGTLLAYMAASFVLYEQDELDLAETYLRRCTEQANKLGSAEVQVFALNGLAHISLARADLAAAADYTKQVDAFLQRQTFPTSIMAYVEYHRFQLLLKQGNLASAAAWVESRTSQPGSLNSYALHRVALPQLLIAQGNFAAALDTLVTFIQEAEATDHCSLLIKGLVLQALVFHAGGNNQQALTTLERALTLARPQGYIRTFVDEGTPMAQLLGQALKASLLPDYTRQLLAAYDFSAVSDGVPTEYLLPEWVPVNQPTLPSSISAIPLVGTPQTDTRQPTQTTSIDLVEPLSKRELEILALIAQGWTNPEIAKQIYISDQTVKVHTRNIYGKLGVNGRREAVAKARELGLLA